MKDRILGLSQKILIIIILPLIILAFKGCTLEEREGVAEQLSENAIQEVDEDVLALVNGEKVYKEEFNQLYEIMESTGIYDDLKELKSNILKRLIENIQTFKLSKFTLS